MMKRKLYILTTYFPPTISIASNRMEAFAKYLNPDFFEVEVVTLATENSEVESLKNLKIKRLPNTSKLNFQKFSGKETFWFHKLKAAYNRILTYFLRNEHKSWQKAAEKYLFNELRVNPEAILLASYAPVAPILAAINLKIKFPKIFLITDFRDSMTNPLVHPALLRYNHKIQTKALQKADLILSVSAPILTEFSNILGGQAHKLLEIRNGYDFELAPTTFFNTTFTISYIGTFYGERKPDYFFKALQQFIKKTNSKLVVQLVGVGNSISIPHEIKDKVQVFPKIEHEQALQMMKQTDALLLLHPRSDYKGVFTGKIFEYLGSLRPIIATVDTQDVAAQLILECKAGFVAEFDQVDQIENAINKAYLLWKNKEKLNFNLELIAQQHRKNQVNILNEALKVKLL